MVPVPVGCFRPSKWGAGINNEFLEYRVLFHITLFPRIKLITLGMSLRRYPRGDVLDLKMVTHIN
jgi:hypothetical protein